MKTYRIDGKLYALKGKNLVLLKAVAKGIDNHQQGLSVVETFKNWLNSPKIVKGFGKCEIKDLKAGNPYTRKDGKVISTQVATLSNGSKFILYENRFNRIN